MDANLVDEVIKRAGGVAALSKALGISHPTVIGWRRRGAVPPDRVEAVAQCTGMAPAEIRPDLARVFSTSTEAAA